MRAGQLWDVAPEWILCGNGSDDILTIITRALVGSGQRLRLPYPSYVLYKTLAEIQGARIEEIRFQPDWTLAHSLSRDPSPDLRLVYLPNPNSPSGTVIPPEQILRIGRPAALPVAGG